MPQGLTDNQLHRKQQEWRARLEAGEIDQKEYKKGLKRDRSRARRRVKKAHRVVMETYKPVSEWDEDELARGRPRAVDGTFKGIKPKWIPAEVAEEAVNLFRGVQEGRLRATVPKALSAIEVILDEDRTDAKGRPLVPIQTKATVAMFVVEHLVGKPKQRVEADISVKLQGILADVMVNPDGMPAIERGTQYIDLESEEIDPRLSGAHEEPDL